MLSTLFIALVAKATLVVGRTPDGFVPNSNADLMVVYGQTAALNGAVVDKGGNTAQCSEWCVSALLNINSHGQRTNNSYQISPGWHLVRSDHG